MTPISSLEPKDLWRSFDELNAIPRASKKEERVIAFMKNFGTSLNLETIVDDIGNVLIKKPATLGMENRQTVVLQSHLDMVHQKNNDVDFDFNTEGIRMKIIDDWVHAEGTTLGADNGIGVATIMSILKSRDIPHPALEALFTIDEETGMTGALELQQNFLTGSILLNLDTEDDTELTIGCAGGIDITGNGAYDSEGLDGTYEAMSLVVKGLSGGHSGMDIHLGLGNANKLMNRILYQADQKFQLRIGSIDGGGLRNAIPRESVAKIYLPSDHIGGFKSWIQEESNAILLEYKTTDPELNIEISSIDEQMPVFNLDFQKRLLRGVYSIPSGIYRMSPDIKGLVQTSNNLARVHVENGRSEILCLTRSSVDSEKMDLANAIASSLQLIGSEVDFGGSYPGWTPKPEAAIVKLMTDLYKEKFNADPDVNACHAGLECGIIGRHYPEMDMISFGPNIRGAHSPDERVQISSVQKFWGFFVDTLQNIPEVN